MSTSCHGVNPTKFCLKHLQFLSALGQFGLKEFALADLQWSDRTLLDTLEETRFGCFWIIYIYIYHYISINSPCHHLSISCSTLVCQTVLCRYFDASGVQAASLARCCSQYLYFRTLQKFRWDLVVIVERITIGFVDSPLFPSGRFYRMGYCFNSFWASRS